MEKLKHFISLKEQSKKDLQRILHIASVLKNYSRDGKKLKGLGKNPFQGKKMLLVFEKSSARTKMSYISAVADLGGSSMLIDTASIHKGVNTVDELHAMMLYADVLVYRALDVKNVEHASSLNVVPVIDACSNKYHPSQTMADILTMAEIAGGMDKIGKVVWLGIENNVSNTLALACHKLGIHLYLASPMVDPDSTDSELSEILKNSPYIHRTLNIKKALKDASFVHTDTWLNMEYFQNGKVKEEFMPEFKKRKKILAPYQLSAKLLKKYKCNAKIMHCMPCHEGYEITRDAIEHPSSVIFAQAENRLHAQKGILWWMFQKNS